jgi:hypothetical protein
LKCDQRSLPWVRSSLHRNDADGCVPVSPRVQAVRAADLLLLVLATTFTVTLFLFPYVEPFTTAVARRYFAVTDQKRSTLRGPHGQQASRMFNVCHGEFQDNGVGGADPNVSCQRLCGKPRGGGCDVVGTAPGIISGPHQTNRLAAALCSRGLRHRHRYRTHAAPMAARRPAVAGCRLRRVASPVMTMRM